MFKMEKVKFKILSKTAQQNINSAYANQIANITMFDFVGTSVHLGTLFAL